MRTVRYRGVVLGATLAWWAGVARAECSKDTDCKGEQVCEAGACVAPAPPPAPVTSTLPAAEGPEGPAPAPAPPAPASPAAAAPQAEQTPAAARLEKKRHSPGMMTAGIVLVAVAPVALVAALVAYSKQNTCEANGYNFDTDGLTRYEANSDCARYDRTIYTGGIGGVVMLGVGIPLVVIGGKREPAVAHVSPWATPHAAGLRLQLQL